MTNVYVPTQEQIRGALGHVYYEVEQFVDLLRLFDTSYSELFVDKSIRNAFMNARLEALLIHTRVLINFFEQSANDRKKDDNISEDYGFPGRPVRLSKSDRTRIDKEVAHLTYSRPSFDAPDRGWVLQDLMPPILERCQEFITFAINNPPSDLMVIPTEAWQRLEDTLKSLYQATE
jgi:hypothetical protein